MHTLINPRHAQKGYGSLCVCLSVSFFVPCSIDGIIIMVTIGSCSLLEDINLGFMPVHIQFVK